MNDSNTPQSKWTAAQKKEAADFWKKNGRLVPPREPRHEPHVVASLEGAPIDSVCDPENGENPKGLEAPVPNARANKADAPAEYDPELGRMLDDLTSVGEEPSPDAGERWLRLATDLATLLVQTSAYHEYVQMPVARLPEHGEAPRIHPRVLAALPELEALHRKLVPGWRDIAEGWLESQARAKIEAKYRPAWEREANEGKRVNLFGERATVTAEKMLRVLLAQGAPTTLGVVPLKVLGSLATLKGKGSQGMTIETAMKKLDLWADASDGDELANSYLKQHNEAKKDRRQKAEEKRRAAEKDRKNVPQK